MDGGGGRGVAPPTARRRPRGDTNLPWRAGQARDAWCIAEGETPADVTWLCSWCSATEAVTYGDWDAPSAEAIQGVLTAFGVPVEKIQEARYFEPDPGKLVA